MSKSIKKIIQGILFAVITVPVFGMVVYMNGRTCMLAFNQPKQPANIGDFNFKDWRC